MSVIPIVIPARMDSERLPGKVLKSIGDLPMLEHVRRQCVDAVGEENVYIATGDGAIIDSMSRYGAQIVQTFENHLNGTSRVREASQTLSLNDVIIVQGDEPFIAVENIKTFQNKMSTEKSADILCATSQLARPEDLTNDEVVKCACAPDGEILFLFRGCPFTRSGIENAAKIQGIIGFRNGSIRCELSEKGTIGAAESIEQLILLENGLRLREVRLATSKPSVNTPEEYDEIIRIYEQESGSNHSKR